MNMTRSLGLLNLALGLAIISGCGGSGGSNNALNVTTPRTALLTLSSAITGTVSSGTLITGYDVTVILPPGVTVKSSKNSPQTDEGVVTVSAAFDGASILSVYTAATASRTGQVRILLAKGEGLSAGVFCTISCDISDGSSPRTSDFVQPTYAVAGFDTVANSTIDLTNQFTFTRMVSLN